MTCPFRLSSLVLVLVLLSGCAAIRPAPPPLTPPEVRSLLESLGIQEQAVSSFYSMGNVVLKKWLVESEEARILVVGTRDPLRIKVEITHSWGPPVLHVLVDRDRLEAFSFPDAVLYTGPATAETLGRFLPCPPDIDSIWALLRGYPALPGADLARAGSGGRIVCDEDCAGSPWTLQVKPRTLEPERLIFPKSSLEVIFSDIQEQGEVRYAGEVEVRPGKGGGKVLIKNERMVFNREIPEQIFELKKPSAYTRIELDEETP
ncbi:MAG: hypothetical protein ACQET7_00905 [Thermodesulfobacteriota bacterium]